MPTLSDEKIIFVSENDLWEVSIKGGDAKRLTTSKGIITNHNNKPPLVIQAEISSQTSFKFNTIIIAAIIHEAIITQILLANEPIILRSDVK